MLHDVAHPLCNIVQHGVQHRSDVAQMLHTITTINIIMVWDVAQMLHDVAHPACNIVQHRVDVAHDVAQGVCNIV